MLDTEKFMQGLHEYLALAFQPITDRLKALEQYAPEPVVVTVEDFEPMVAAKIADAVTALPAPKDGKDVDPAEVQRMVAEAVAALPAPKDGESVMVDQVMPELRAELAKAIEAIPAPKDVPTAKDVAKALDGRFSEWALGFERQATDLFQRAIDRMPKPEPGKDGRDFGAFEFEYDGERSLTIRYEKDGETVDQVYRMPIVIDAGFYQEGNDYEKGDGTTFGGSYWIAQTDTRSKPEIGSTEWRLAVKKGRSAK